jgi:hypothetical protein
LFDGKEPESKGEREEKDAFEALEWAYRRSAKPGVSRHSGPPGEE